MRVVVVGAGIVGLAHAMLLQREGHRVTVLERASKAQGASVRNFGMIWPIGQPVGRIREMALRSRERWLEVLHEAAIWHRECGSLHLAYAPTDLAVLEEFARLAPDAARMIPAEEATAMRPGVRSEGLLGALWSDTEVCVDPRITVGALARHLMDLGVEIRFGEAVREVAPGRVQTETETFAADRIFVCTGPDLAETFGVAVRTAGLVRCRLQMLRLRPRERESFGPHLCAGLTLGHYANFRICRSLPAALEAQKARWMEHHRRGIHLLVSQHGDGTLTVGDSHQYGDQIAPFRDEGTDRLILSGLDEFLPVDRYDVVERWDGFYNTHAQLPYYREEPMPGVTLVNCFGTGMTLSFGVAEESIRRAVAA